MLSLKELSAITPLDAVKLVFANDATILPAKEHATKKYGRLDGQPHFLPLT
jgi:hypothetical protein